MKDSGRYNEAGALDVGDYTTHKVATLAHTSKVSKMHSSFQKSSKDDAQSPAHLFNEESSPFPMLARGRQGKFDELKTHSMIDDMSRRSI